MLKIMIEFFQDFGMKQQTSENLSRFLLVIFVVLLCILGNVVARKTVLNFVAKVIKNNKNPKNQKISWLNHMLDNKVFHRLAYLISPLIVSFFVEYFPSYKALVNRGIQVYVVLVMILIVDAVLSAIDDIYVNYEISKTKPMKGIIQVTKIVVFIIGGIISMAALIGESPVIILGGISALTAVFMLVFQNTILGFVAGIQLTSNDMIRIGDWIEVPKYDANGTVIELSLLTVKVQNFDYTITSIPANILTSDSFKNWRGMQDCGGRRIMRAINIDVNSIRFCTDEMLEHFKKIEYIKDYITTKQAEIIEYNRNKQLDMTELSNGRRLTNIGVFRVYVTNYLRNHPGLRKDMTLMVRQLSPTSEGLPLEIYAFSNGTVWADYENIQSDIFDHLFAVVKEFGLQIYQSPSGQDFSKINIKN
ncbi:mechanosensitive ion channel family protein [Clostridium sp. Marseille-P299]|uniref:mechanosensitive ion channel family protein n=1 Tax=Clostridium sp. Marseille-P299 TaxID=1805477 RepID=UPI000A709D2C|nr:mechanosensitive ion channel domain-containing protein [Clostridium sp. Marseille-P299]